MLIRCKRNPKIESGLLKGYAQKSTYRSRSYSRSITSTLRFVLLGRPFGLWSGSHSSLATDGIITRT